MPGDKYDPSIEGEESTPLVAGRAPHAGFLNESIARISYRMLVGLCFVTISASMIFFNKYLMVEQHFPFATFLVTIQMIIMFSAMLCLRYAVPSLFPAAEALLRSPEKIPSSVWGAFFLVGMCATGSIVLSNTAYRFAAVSFLQMIKESTLVTIYALSVLFGLQPLEWRPAVVILFVACFAVCAVGKAATFSVVGLALQGGGSTLGALQLVLSQRVMTSIDGVKIDPMTMVLCLAPMMLITLLPANFFMWDPRIPERLIVWWPLVLANIGLAILLQVASTFAIRELSATGHSLASITKDLGIVVLAGLMLHEAVRPIQMVGFAGVLSGTFLFTAMRVTTGAPLKQSESAAPGGSAQARLCSLQEHPRDAEKVV